MAVTSGSWWELVGRAATPAAALAALASRLVAELSAAQVAIGVVERDEHAVRWVAGAVPGGAFDGPPIRLRERDTPRLLGVLRRGDVVRAAAGALPAELAPLARLGGGHLAVLGLGDAGLLVVRWEGAAPRATERLLDDVRDPLATALARAEAGGPAAASGATLATDAPIASDRDGLSDRIIGADGGLRAVMMRVAQVSRSDVPVLILGETGAGKEVIARALHVQSPRAAAPFIRVNCGAIPPELIDSELFGHERGSFTGAVAQRRGWFEQADGGTLFLDEIGELPLAAQVRLLRILQEGTFQRVGGERAVRVDVRVVAATHRDLASMVQGARFREDLWYRLAVFPIYLPPLRDHKEDLPAMAEHFARRAAARFGVAPRLPTADDLARLAAYDWPGNVRELGAVIDRAVLLGEGERLEIGRALGESTAPGAPRRKRATIAAPASDEVATLDEAMRAHIEHALKVCRGKVEGLGGAAEKLEVNPHTLRGKMRRLGIDWNAFRPR